MFLTLREGRKKLWQISK